MQHWHVDNPAGAPVEIVGEDLISALARHRTELIALAFPEGIEAIETAWMHWDQDLLGGEGGIEVQLTATRDGSETRGRFLIHAVPADIAPDTGRPVFF